MDSRMEEALRAKAMAEKHFSLKDYMGAKSYGLKAQMLCPELEGISQMVATFGVHVAAEPKINGEPDFYSILGLKENADKSKIKKRYKKLAVLLHPDKNRSVGADEAFRLVSEAWSHLSDNYKRSCYDERRNLFAGNTSVFGVYENCSKFPISHGNTSSFWTVCTSCNVQYEYLRKYVNKRLSCKNCRGVFVAVETGLAHMDGSFPYCTYSRMPKNRHASHNYGVAYCASNGAMGHLSGYAGSEYVPPNISFQGTLSENSVGVLDRDGLASSSFVFCQSNGEATKTKVMKHSESSGCVDRSNLLKPKRGRPSKKTKLDMCSTRAFVQEETLSDFALETRLVNGNLKPASNPSSQPETSIKRFSAHSFDARQYLIDRARTEICKKLQETEFALEAAAVEAKKRITLSKIDVSVEPTKVSGSPSPTRLVELKRTGSIHITVPDSDFHDFDLDRSEECFKPKQIWALYDEEDGMPRLYCLIRDVISVNPFQIFISYLSSKSDSEFGTVKWLDSGFTKSCGSFRVFHSEMVEQVNIFSHLLRKEKAGRGGCVRIYPRSGDIWAVYRNWSPDWDRSTPDEVRHQYEMVEVLDDYSEELGVWVAPLMKLNHFKTVYQRNPNNEAIRYIPKKEMLQFSHQVPSRTLDGDSADLPQGCWDLDPAAIPDELLRRETAVCDRSKLDMIDELFECFDDQHPEEPEYNGENCSFPSNPTEITQITPDLHSEERVEEERTSREEFSFGECIMQTGAGQHPEGGKLRQYSEISIPSGN